ncbi:MAG: magnesium transporter [Hyphomicrobium sp.]|nr:magnesium transporter [Hyphomicrobium sp.]MBN9266357.1 magnesium transporter [Hyphomicrobium sp.]ODT17391.1 MAG: magnesium transporter [Hyphomicrobium sp. SCN 65-11]
MSQEAPETEAGDSQETVNGRRLEALRLALQEGQAANVRVLTHGLRAPDLADLIELLEPDERVQLIQILGDDFDPEVMSELEEGVRDQLAEALPNEVLARVITELDTDDAAYVLESLDKEDQEDVLAQMPSSDRIALERNLEYPEETAGRLMQTDFVAVPPFWTVGRVIDHMREADDLPETFTDIFVVDPSFRVIGTIDLSRLLRTKRDVLVEKIMEADQHTVSATLDQEEMARQFERYDLKSAPVVDANKRLVGVVTVDDIVEVIEDETDEDLRRLAGVGDESIGDSVITTVRSRIVWLAINLCTAGLAASVIKQFDASIEQMVALAVLMPIVASMGGNAGTQTMAVTVRALATKDLGPANRTRIILREAAVGLINGLTLAAILGPIVFLWFGIGTLGIVIAVALIINLFTAAVAGILVPLTLDRLGFDPAVASATFVTTTTDVIGFLAFLGLATLVLL